MWRDPTCNVSMCMQMLTQPSQCYLVLLIATAGLTFRAKEPLPQGNAKPALPQGNAEPAKLDPPQPPSIPGPAPQQMPATLVSLLHTHLIYACAVIVRLTLYKHGVQAWYTLNWLQRGQTHSCCLHAQHTSLCGCISAMQPFGEQCGVDSLRPVISDYFDADGVDFSVLA